MTTISASTTTTTAYKVTADTTGTLVFQTGSGPTTAVTIDGSQNVGVGVTPSVWSTSFRGFQVGGAGSVWSSASGFAGTYLGNNYYYSASGRTYLNTNTAVEIALASGGIQFSVAPSGTAGTAVSFTQAMTLDASGNLLVGTTDANPNSGYGVKINAGTGARTSVVGAADTNANFAITVYSTNSAAYRFQVGYGGTIYATSTSITAISDASLKTNVRDLETGLTEVMALQPRRFDWINGDASNVAGFIAQEVQQVLPDLVEDYQYNDEETKLGLKMGDILPTLVKAIQEQQALITQLQADVAALKGA